MFKAIGHGLPLWRQALMLISCIALMPSAMAAEDATRLGILTCNSIPGTRVNLIIRSTTDVHCQFKNADGKVEHYIGETGIAFGADLTFAKEQETFAFTVISASALEMGKHLLAGRYVGGKASASVGLGVGAAVLVGGDRDNFTLQPLALEGNTGVGLAAGLGFLYIEKGR
ncbi:MAG: DUF992 domain-containing protein [Pseudomonadota bacterium]